MDKNLSIHEAATSLVCWKEHERPKLGDRRTQDAAQRLCRQPNIRKRIEEAFGWIKGIGGLRQTKLRGLAKVDWSFTFAAAAYNLVRLPKLIGVTA